MNETAEVSLAYRHMQPELLATSELLEVLTSRCITDLEGAGREELIEIFKRVAMPLPQREFSGNSARELRLRAKQKRIKREKRTKMDVPTLNTPSQVSSSLPSRLKPPPSGSPKKIIQINSKPEVTSKTKMTDSEANGKRKRIKIDFSDSSEKSTPIPKVIDKRATEPNSSIVPAKKHKRVVI